jgi:hypothetical protein
MIPAIASGLAFALVVVVLAIILLVYLLRLEDQDSADETRKQEPS